MNRERERDKERETGILALLYSGLESRQGRGKCWAW